MNEINRTFASIHQTALVLEGGGMRGVFSVGVLDYLLDQQIHFPYTIGVSAGASNGLSYASRQRGRSLYSNTELLRKYNYIGLSHLLRGKGYIDLDFVFHVYPDRYYPFDFQTYAQTRERFVMVASNCLTGEAIYFEEKNDEARMVEICKASCTLPILCPITYVDGIPMVDGGVCDAIPVRRALHEGYSKLVVVLTRNQGYRKADKEAYLPAFVFRQYPSLREKLRTRYLRYNETLDLVEQLEAEGKALVIRPERPLQVSRTCNDISLLRALYVEGYQLAKEQLSGRFT